VLSLTSLGGAGTVTGSKHLIEHDGRRLLFDCGLFQGPRELRELNWKVLPVDARSVDRVVLTHAHLDHSGYLPKLVRDGFRGPIYATPATIDVARIILLDSAHLQEKDAEFANRHSFSRHKPPLPLYTTDDAERALEQFRPVEFHRSVDLGRCDAATAQSGSYSWSSNGRGAGRRTDDRLFWRPWPIQRSYNARPRAGLPRRLPSLWSRPRAIANIRRRTPRRRWRK
jgi:Cft2 family RNA processing exonuclease